jgi:hypothetical protein
MRQNAAKEAREQPEQPKTREWLSKDYSNQKAPGNGVRCERWQLIRSNFQLRKGR